MPSLVTTREVFCGRESPLRPGFSRSTAVKRSAFENEGATGAAFA